MNRKEWFSTAGSAVRHFEGVGDEELDWTDRAYTFNTSCFSCHVSQLATNYEPATDSYATVWAEPAFSCETCHGPAGEHVKAFEGWPPASPEGLEDRLGEGALEAAAQRPVASLPRQGEPSLDGLPAGDRFFDHFDLTTLESRTTTRTGATSARTTRSRRGE